VAAIEDPADQHGELFAWTKTAEIMRTHRLDLRIPDARRPDNSTGRRA
jgi:hypothetical protein